MKQTLPPAIFDEHVKRSAVRCPGEPRRRAIEPRRQPPGAIASALKKREPALIVERTLDVIGVPGNVAPVWCIERVLVGKAAVCGEHAAAAAREVEYDDVGGIHQLRL